MRDPSIIAAQRQRIPSEDFLHGVNAGRTATTSVASFSASPLTEIPAQEAIDPPLAAGGRRVARACCLDFAPSPGRIKSVLETRKSIRNQGSH
jgi:hypothetical protein